MRQIYLGLKFAFSYFTVLPVRFKTTDVLTHPKTLASMLFFFPFCGLVIGALSAGLYLYLLSSLGPTGAVIAAVFYLFLYGFIHTEAIADVTDALYAKHSGKDPYKVIKESTIGAMGMLYTLGFVLIKVALIAHLFSHQKVWAFLGILLVSRFALVVLMKSQTFRSSFVNALQASLSPLVLWGALLSVCLVGFWLTQGLFFLLFFSGFLVAFGVAKTLEKKLGFLNGDVLGASLESVELLLFLGVALWA